MSRIEATLEAAERGEWMSERVVWGVLHVTSDAKFCGIELFERKENAERFMREEMSRHPDDSFELLNMAVQPWHG